MADEILANLRRLTGAEHWDEDVMLYRRVALWEHGSQIVGPCVCDYICIVKLFFPSFRERKENKLHQLAF